MAKKKKTVKKKTVKNKAAPKCVCPPNAMLSVRGFALSGGLLWALAVLFTALAALYVDGWGQSFVNMFDSIYIGYEATPLGAIIGGLWGFIDGFVGCAVFAWLYNKFR